MADKKLVKIFLLVFFGIGFVSGLIFIAVSLLEIQSTGGPLPSIAISTILFGILEIVVSSIFLFLVWKRL